jgi:hypothetical protein
MTIAGERLDPPSRHPRVVVVMPPSTFGMSIHGTIPAALWIRTERQRASVGDHRLIRWKWRPGNGRWLNEVIHHGRASYGGSFLLRLILITFVAA